jgi:hypothetical protein
MCPCSVLGQITFGLWNAQTVSDRSKTPNYKRNYPRYQNHQNVRLGETVWHTCDTI